MEEFRLMETVVENYLQAVEELAQHQSNYAALMSSDRTLGQPYLRAKESLERDIRSLQHRVENTNLELKSTIEPLTDFSSQTNKVMELIPIRRGGSRTEHFRLAYARSHILSVVSEEIPLPDGGAQGAPGGSVLTNGRVDWDKLHRQMTNVRGEAKIKIDFPWFDDWLKAEKESVDLFKWSAEINRNLEAKHAVVVGEEHDPDSYKVELSAEAQLMRWTYGASGLSGEFNPFEGKATVKADGKAELVLAEAKGAIDYYTPAGGLMLACELPGQDQIFDLGMVRSHAFLAVAGGVGASVAAELNLNVEMKSGRLSANGIEGGLVQFGLPGEQRAIIRQNSDGATDSTEAKIGMAAFAGGEAEVTVGVQLEWKSPEAGHKFKPFAKTAPGGAAVAGIGMGAEFSVSYRNGKFRIAAKVGLCFGLGAKGKIDFEVDAGLVMEFAKWVYYQLKNINYKRLFFIDAEAYVALSNIVLLSIGYGEEMEEFMYDGVGAISATTEKMWTSLVSSYDDAEIRSELAERINEIPNLLAITSPDSKGGIVYWLMQVNYFDRFHPGNRDWGVLFDDFTLFGRMVERKEAIMVVFSLVQSKGEYDNVMQRVTVSVGSKIEPEEGERRVLEFLALGEVGGNVLSSNYPERLRELRDNLKPVASVGSEVVRNGTRGYFNQSSVNEEFYRPCENPTECVV
ncbi:hypothetical protein ACUN9Y_08280 [Halomonas sp. V046]|uniref:hypothetical protein n=1 Tax=Halomonas sp. V046 TaxID=3459611 RepID=UPI004044830B